MPEETSLRENITHHDLYALGLLRFDTVINNIFAVSFLLVL